MREATAHGWENGLLVGVVADVQEGGGGIAGDPARLIHEGRKKNNLQFAPLDSWTTILAFG